MSGLEDDPQGWEGADELAPVPADWDVLAETDDESESFLDGAA